MKAQRGSGGTELTLFLNLGPRYRWVFNATREREPVPIVQGVGWAPEPVWTGAENFTSIEI